MDDKYTNVTGTTKQQPDDLVAVISPDGIRYITVKEAAIEEIKEQPFFGEPT